MVASEGEESDPAISMELQAIRKPAPRLRPGGLRAQFLAGLAAFILITLGIFSLVVAQLGERQARRAALEEATHLAQLLAADETLRNPGSRQEQFERLDRYQRRSGLVLIALRGIKRPTHAGSLKVRDAVLQAIDRQDPGASLAGSLEIEGMPHVYARAYLPGEEHQVVVVALSMQGSIEQLGTMRRIFWLFLFLEAAAVVLLGYAALSYVVLRPIRALGHATERAAQGDLASPIGLLPRNEIGQVAYSFNVMLGRLEDQRGQLERQLQELQEAYAELQRTQQTLVRSEKLASVGQLAAGVAHEVGNPLTAIQGYMDLLADGGLDEETSADLIARCKKQLERIRRIIGELLDFSRDDTDQPIGPTDLLDALQEASDLIGALPQGKRCVIELPTQERAPRVLAVHSQLVQVLINLMVNAADAMKEVDAPLLQITLSQKEQRLQLEICDNGPGIAPEFAERIFDPFFTTKEPGAGTGLGLAVCARIMERFGGELSVETGREGGACFRLELLRA